MFQYLFNGKRYHNFSEINMLLYYQLVAILAVVSPLIIVAHSACTTTNTPKSAFSVASGWDAEVVATDLTSPRGILFDKLGQLVVVEQNHGLKVLKLSDDGGVCVTSKSATVLLNDTSVSA
jgi:glucose/arabinose dehydrogenase